MQSTQSYASSGNLEALRKLQPLIELDSVDQKKRLLLSVKPSQEIIWASIGSWNMLMEQTRKFVQVLADFRAEVILSSVRDGLILL